SQLSRFLLCCDTFLLWLRLPPRSTLFPYTTLFRSEVYRLSGRPISAWQREGLRPRLPVRVLQLVLAPADRSVLHGRIARRFDQMLAQGLLDEVRALRALPELASHPAPLDLPAIRAVGYRQAW